MNESRPDCGAAEIANIALVGDTEVCVCKPAVIRAYEGMKRSGSTEQVAIDVAKRVLVHHHPTMPERRIKITVERWVYAGDMH